MTQSSTRPKPRSSGYIPTLDGWRAIAVFSVIAFHGPLLHVGRLSDSWLHANGGLGGYLFFAISGLLICSRLLDEEVKNGTISLSSFYIRRTFRILPAMTAYLVVIGILGLFGTIHVELKAWLTSLFFVNNYYQFFRHDITSYPYTAHFWTLAVEEHFYLLLPFILVFFKKIRARLLISMAFASISLSLIHDALERGNPLVAYSGGRSEFQIYVLFFPAFLAVILRNQEIRRKWANYFRPWIVVGLAPVLWWISIHISYLLTWVVFVPSYFPIILLSTMFHPQSWLSRALEWSPMRALGRISYGLYLWQQLFFVHLAQTTPSSLGRAQAAPWNLIWTVVFAMISYFLLEKPLIRLGHRLAPPPTPGHKDLDVQLKPVVPVQTDSVFPKV